MSAEWSPSSASVSRPYETSEFVLQPHPSYCLQFIFVQSCCWACAITALLSQQLHHRALESWIRGEEEKGCYHVVEVSDKQAMGRTEQYAEEAAEDQQTPKLFQLTGQKQVGENKPCKGCRG